MIYRTVLLSSIVAIRTCFHCLTSQFSPLSLLASPFCAGIVAREKRTLSNEISNERTAKGSDLYRSIRFDNSNPDNCSRQTIVLFLYLTTQQFNNGKKTNLAFDVSSIRSKFHDSKGKLYGIQQRVQREGKNERRSKWFESLYTETRYTRVSRGTKLESRSGSPHSLPSFPLFVRLPFPAFILARFPAVKWKLEISAHCSLLSLCSRTRNRGEGPAFVDTSRFHFLLATPFNSSLLSSYSCYDSEFFFFSFSSPANIFNHEAREKIWVSLFFRGGGKYESFHEIESSLRRLLEKLLNAGANIQS